MTILTVGSTGGYATIQDAIDAASADDIIQVEAGTYTGNITIDKSITLLGAQAGTAATGSARASGESVIDGGGQFDLTIVADNVTIDGFEIRNFYRDGIRVYTALDEKPGDPSIDAYRTGVTITNNWIHSEATTGQHNGILLGESSTGYVTAVAEVNDLNISRNYIEIAAPANLGRGLAFTSHFTFVTFNDTVIDSNIVMAATSNALFSGGVTSTFQFDSPQITDNQFTGTFNSYNLFDAEVAGNVFTGMVLIGIDQSTVEGNTFNSTGYYGLGLWGDEYGANVSQNSTISNNTFNYNIADNGATYEAGLAFRPGVLVDGISLDNNTFHDGGFSSTLPAQDVLWRGSADGNTLDAAMIAALNGGTELSVILQGRDGDDTLIGSSLNDTLDGGNGSDTAQGYDASFHLALDSGHWVVTNGADETDTLLGVERVVIDGKTYLLVDKLGDGTGGYQSVQAAIDAANAGDTILVAAGIYPENLNIDTSGLTIRNAPGETVIINGQVNGLAGAINVGTGISVTIESDSPANLVVNAPSGVGQAAALYLVGNNDGSSISGVTLHATGGYGLLTGGGQDNVTFTGNVFENATAGRPLAYVNGADSLGAGNASSNVSFIDNQFSGSAGGSPLLASEADGDRQHLLRLEQLRDPRTVGDRRYGDGQQFYRQHDYRRRPLCSRQHRFLRRGRSGGR